MEEDMGESSSKDSLSVRDNRTGQEYEIEILDGNVIRAMDLRRIRVDQDEFGMMSYDPAFTNTASTRSTVTDIDGGKGILRYRGYPIEELGGLVTRRQRSGSFYLGSSGWKHPSPERQKSLIGRRLLQVTRVTWFSQ